MSHYKDDILETTTNVETLPSFLSSTKNGQVSQIYKMVGKNIELLQWIPCYCGCEQIQDIKVIKIVLSGK